MQTGQLDQRIQLQSLTETNKSGSLTQAFTTFATVWSYITTQRGTEAFEAARLNARETIRCKVRFRTDINVKTRVVWNGQAYNIRSIDRSQRRQGDLWFTAEVVGAS